MCEAETGGAGADLLHNLDKIMLIFADLGQGRSRRYNASRAFIALGGRGDEPARVCGRLARAQSLDLISFNARSAARNDRESVTGAL